LWVAREIQPGTDRQRSSRVNTRGNGTFVNLIHPFAKTVLRNIECPCPSKDAADFLTEFRGFLLPAAPCCPHFPCGALWLAN
jgi:hypothetical protein